MSIKGYTPPSVTVSIPSATGPQPVVVYGLGLDVAVILAREYGEQLAPIYKQSVDGTLTETGAIDLLLTLIEEIPPLVDLGLFYALKLDDPADMALLASIPLAAKVELAEAAMRLTFKSEAASGKTFEIVSRAFREAAALMPPKP